ncbi:MAG: DMT family transporter [Eubacterium sp.]|nr:DMT family transporter [Eubacterium sp.]
MEKSSRDYHKGVIYLIISAFFFALMAVFIRVAGEIPTMEKAFFRNLVAFFVAGGIILKDRHNEKKEAPVSGKEGKESETGKLVPKGAWTPIVMRALFGTVGVFCNFYAVDHLVLSDAAILNKMSPFFAVLASYIILKEKFTLSQGLAVLIAFIGGLFVVKPGLSGMDFLPALIGLIGGVGAGIAYSFLRKAGTMGVKGPVVVICFAGFSCLLTLPIALIQFVPMSMYQFAMLILTGASAAAGQFAITAAYYHAPAKEISIFDYTQLIFSTMMGFFIFGMVPDYISIIGYAIIVAMAGWMFVYNKKRVEVKEDSAKEEEK